MSYPGWRVVRASMALPPRPLFVPRHVRRDVHLAQSIDKVACVVVLVSSQCDGLVPGNLRSHQKCRVALRRAIGLRHHRPYQQAVAVLHQHMTQIAQLGLGSLRLLIQPGSPGPLWTGAFRCFCVRRESPIPEAPRPSPLRPWDENSSGWPRPSSASRPP